MSPDAPRSRIFGFEAEVLAQSRRGDGRHRVLKIELGGRPVVLKLFGRKRSVLRERLRDLGQRFIVGKTGMAPSVRCRTERETIELWRRHGFDVPALLDVELPPEVPHPRLAFEFVEGGLVTRYLASREVFPQHKRTLIERLAREWSRRHALAIRLREPRLIQAHAFFGHLIRSPREPGRPPRIVTFDFEVGWARRGAVARLASLEIAQYLESLHRWVRPEEFEPLLESFVRAYPDRARLARVAPDARRGKVPWLAPLSALARRVRGGDRGARRLPEILAQFERVLQSAPAD